MSENSGPLSIHSTIVCNETYNRNSQVRNEISCSQNSQKFVGNQSGISDYNIQISNIKNDKFWCHTVGSKKDSIDPYDNSCSYKSFHGWSPKSRISYSRRPLRNRSRYRDEDRWSSCKGRSEKTPKRLKYDKYQRRSITPSRSSRSHSADENSRLRYDRSKQRSYDYPPFRSNLTRKKSFSKLCFFKTAFRKRNILDKWSVDQYQCWWV